MYKLTQERLSGQGIFSEPCWPRKQNSLCLFAYQSNSFHITIWYDFYLFCGRSCQKPIIPDPAALFSAIDKIKSDFDPNALSYFGNVDIYINGAVFKRDMKNPDVIWYNWPSSWLADLHVFHKVYDNFAKNFNPQNYIIN